MNDLQNSVPLASLTTLGIGGKAAYFTDVANPTNLADTFAFAADNALPTFLLGGGSNLVVADTGFPGIVLRLPLRNVRAWAEGDKVALVVGAGVDWDKFIDYTVGKNLAGVECLAGIPGLVGASPVQNIGAYGQEIAETIVNVLAYDTKENDFTTIRNADCGFAYRKSRFNHDEPGRYLILSVTFALTPNGAPTLKYTDLQKHFAGNPTPTLSEVAVAVRQIRAQKGMVLNPSDPDTKSAGSFFKNPIVNATTFAEIQRLAQTKRIERVPNYPQDDGTMKIPAAWLMEHAGLQRGQTFGDGAVALSTKHILALTNRGGATASGLVHAAREIQAHVFDTWGVPIVPEPVFVGFEEDALLPDGATRPR